ncbi:MAG: GtrA family protein [Anaerolineae bacterium]
MADGLISRVLLAVATRLGAEGGGWRGCALRGLVSRRHEVERFCKFGLVGVLGTIVDFGLLNALILVAQTPKFWANTCSFCAAALSNFYWNRVWTFPESRARPLTRQLAQFFAVSVGGYAINQVLFLSLDRWVFAPWGTLGYNLAKATAIVVVLFWNFGVNRAWTYRGL